MTEIEIYRHLAQFMKLKYPKLLYHFDLSGVHNASQFSRNLYSYLNGRGFVDLFIYEPRADYHGFALEIKKAGTTVWLKDSSLTKNPHIVEQRQLLEMLKSHGYYADFGIGLDDCISKIEAYLTLQSP